MKNQDKIQEAKKNYKFADKIYTKYKNKTDSRVSKLDRALQDFECNYWAVSCAMPSCYQDQMLRDSLVLFEKAYEIYKKVPYYIGN